MKKLIPYIFAVISSIILIGLMAVLEHSPEIIPMVKYGVMFAGCVIMFISYYLIVIYSREIDDYSVSAEKLKIAMDYRRQHEVQTVLFNDDLNRILGAYSVPKTSDVKIKRI